LSEFVNTKKKLENYSYIGIPRDSGFYGSLGVWNNILIVLLAC